VLPSRLLIGVEADASFPNTVAGTSTGVAANGIASYGDTVLHSGTARGRIGYVFDNNWLVYGTGGFAWSYDQIVRTQLAGGSLPPGADESAFLWRLAGQRVQVSRSRWLRTGARASSISTPG